MGIKHSAFTIQKLNVWLLRAPLKVPRQNAFGTQTSRSALLVQLIDVDGVEGWGEAFSAWPAFGAEYRYQILTDLVTGWIEGQEFSSPENLYAAISSRLGKIRVQCGDNGAFEQAVAAVDIAGWDLSAKRAEMPLWEALGGDKPKPVPVYASALTANTLEPCVVRAREQEITAFKLKVGFGQDKDQAALTTLRDEVDDIVGHRLMVDANQAWSLGEAKAMAPFLNAFTLDWVEEPLSAEASYDEWRALTSELEAPLAAGENVRGDRAWEDLIASGAIGIAQPDIIKSGGLTGVRRIAQEASARGVRFCPHFLGAAVGLLATAHLCAAVGQNDTMLELDVSESPFQTLLGNIEIADGSLRLPDGAGLGATPDKNLLTRFVTARTT